MKEKPILTADIPDARAAMTAMQRAAELARQTAIQTETAIIIVQDGKRVRVTAEELRQQKALAKS
jgi:hypothetical protein